ncbi:hypothetical protein [Kitasatospora sp. NPDC056531]|uniref:hypothetical protein n=1 Tax=Kitasatospora sp. NPDC056531 TaxID=3345856 RepID=UPI0036A5B7CB
MFAKAATLLRISFPRPARLWLQSGAVEVDRGTMSAERLASKLKVLRADRFAQWWRSRRRFAGGANFLVSTC